MASELYSLMDEFVTGLPNKEDQEPLSVGATVFGVVKARLFFAGPSPAYTKLPTFQSLTAYILQNDDDIMLKCHRH
eukprot:scaffold135439_cov18-Prasinocladus_malaysianus.AAC.1